MEYEVKLKIPSQSVERNQITNRNIWQKLLYYEETFKSIGRLYFDKS